MPKVTEHYLNEKKDQIVDAAFAVCSRKPVYEVTMSDIVAETGMSQGGVYKYFGNIEEVFAALKNRANSAGSHIKEIDGIIASDYPPEIMLQKLFAVFEQFFSEMLIRYNKILFELGTYYAHDPEKQARLNQYEACPSVTGYLIQHTSDIMKRETETGYFKPVMPLSDILAFMIAAFDGIIRDVTLTRCYPQPVNQPPFQFREKYLIQSLYISILTLLGASQ